MLTILCFVLFLADENDAWKVLKRGWTNKWQDAPLVKWTKTYRLRITSETNTIELLINPSDLIDAKSNKKIVDLTDSEKSYPYEGEIAANKLGNKQFDDFPAAGGETSPQTTKTTQTNPTQTKTTQTNPTQTKTTQTNPTQTKTTSSNPTQTKTTQTNPTQTKTTQTNPTQTKTTQTNPTQTNPTQTNPTQSNPTQSNPSNSNDNEANTDGSNGEQESNEDVTNGANEPNGQNSNQNNNSPFVVDSNTSPFSASSTIRVCLMTLIAIAALLTLN